MPDTLLSTKLYIPRSRGELVPRPRLSERLDAGLSGKLTLVSAPAGYGKTTLVSDWIHSVRAHGADPVRAHGRAPLRVAWLSLDASDNDVARFLSYLIAALQQIDPGIGAEIQPVLETASDPPIERLLTALVNDIAAACSQQSVGQQPVGIVLPPAPCPRCVLVLDDYHVIRELDIHKALDFTLNHLPPGMHIVLISRANPPMPLGRLRVQRQLTEIREADLRFTPDEVAAFLNDRMGLGLSGPEIASLGARTEGWVAGLQLAALALQDRAERDDRIAAFGGSHHHLIEYLVHEVMARQSDEVQTFLLRTSILERFNASLCDAILDQGPTSRSAEILDHLERANLFLVPLDDEGQWYRYHHLFADFLRRRLRRTSPALVPELYVRASEWYEAQGMVDEAIEHALAGDDARYAARLLDRHIKAYVFNAEIIRVRRWVERLPEEARCSLSRLCVYTAWALQFEYQLEAAESVLAQAEAHVSPTARPATEQPAMEQGTSMSASEIVAHTNAIRAYMALHRGEFAHSVDLARATLGALPEEATDQELLVDDLCILRGATLLGLGIGYFQLGQTEAAYQALESALPLNRQVGNRYGALSCTYYMMWLDVVRGALSRVIANGERELAWIDEWSGSSRLKRPPARMLAHLRRQMGIVHYERDELDQAAQYFRQVNEYYELEDSRYRVLSYARLIDLTHALGDVETACGYLQKFVRLHLTPGFSVPDTPLAAMIAERSLRLGRSHPDGNALFADAVRWADTSGLNPEDEFRYEQEYEYLTLARVRIAQDRAKEVIPLLDRLIASAGGARRNGELIAYLALLAVAHHECNQMDAALAALSRALALGEPEGYVRTFVDHSTPMADLLQQALARGMAACGLVGDYVGKLLAAMEGQTKAHPASPVVPVEHTLVDVGHPSFVVRRPSSADSPSSALVEPLNDREMQILRLIAAGLSDRQIAEELYLSVNTVKWYNRQLYSKLGVSRRGQAVARAREIGIL